MQFRELRELLESTRSYTLYHSTDRWKDILSQNLLKASDSDYGADGRINSTIGKGAKGFISFARTIENSYTTDILSSSSRLNVTLAFDGRALKSRYFVRPVNYLDNNNNMDRDTKRGQGKNEYEERLFTDRDGIPVEPFLTGVHMYDPTVQTNKELEHRSGRRYNDDMRKSMRKFLGDQFAELERLMKRYPDVPFYLYYNESHYYNARWAEASQINPALFDKDGLNDDD